MLQSPPGSPHSVGSTLASVAGSSQHTARKISGGASQKAQSIKLALPEPPRAVTPQSPQPEPVLSTVVIRSPNGPRPGIPGLEKRLVDPQTGLHTPSPSPERELESPERSEDERPTDSTASAVRLLAARGVTYFNANDRSERERMQSIMMKGLNGMDGPSDVAGLSSISEKSLEHNVPELKPSMFVLSFCLVGPHLHVRDGNVDFTPYS